MWTPPVGADLAKARAQALPCRFAAETATEHNFAVEWDISQPRIKPSSAPSAIDGTSGPTRIVAGPSTVPTMTMANSTTMTTEPEHLHIMLYGGGNFDLGGGPAPRPWSTAGQEFGGGLEQPTAPALRYSSRYNGTLRQIFAEQVMWRRPSFRIDDQAHIRSRVATTPVIVRMHVGRLDDLARPRLRVFSRGISMPRSAMTAIAAELIAPCSSDPTRPHHRPAAGEVVEKSPGHLG